MLAGALPTLQLAEEGGGRLVRTCRGGKGGPGAQGGARGLLLPHRRSDQPYSLGPASSTLAKIVVPVGQVCWQEGGAAAASPCSS